MDSNDRNMKNIPMRRSCKSTIPDLLTICIIYSIAMVLEWSPNIPPHTQVVPGIDDGQINYKYMYPMRDSTIPTPTMFLICFLFWSSLIFTNGIIMKLRDPTFTLKAFASFLYLTIRIVMFSFATSSLITDIIKKTVGAVRPYYGNLQKEMEINPDEFDQRDISNARQSFISGHSSESMAMLFLLTIYLYKSFSYIMNCHFSNREVAAYSVNNPHSYFLGPLWNKLRFAPLLSIVIVFIPCYVAIYVALSRIIDYKHTAADITAGSVVGACCAYLSYLVHYNETYMIFNFKHAQGLHDGIKEIINMASYNSKTNNAFNIKTSVHSKSHTQNNDTPTQEIEVNTEDMALENNTNV